MQNSSLHPQGHDNAKKTQMAVTLISGRYLESGESVENYQAKRTKQERLLSFLRRTVTPETNGGGQAPLMETFSYTGGALRLPQQASCSPSQSPSVTGDRTAEEGAHCLHECQSLASTDPAREAGEERVEA